MAKQPSKSETTARKAEGPPPPVAGVGMEITVEMGRVRLPIDTLLGWEEGSILELNKPIDSPVDIKLNGEPFATGEVVGIEENFGARVIRLVNGGAADA